MERSVGAVASKMLLGHEVVRGENEWVWKEKEVRFYYFGFCAFFFNFFLYHVLLLGIKKKYYFKIFIIFIYFYLKGFSSFFHIFLKFCLVQIYLPRRNPVLTRGSSYPILYPLSQNVY